tara:strand:- start:91 stop:1023 length:933 start_codon:yes stop_codon:yes gene_type:complete
MTLFKNLSPLAKSGILLVSGISIFGFADNLTLLVSDDVSVGQFHFSRSLCASTIVLVFAYFTGANIIPKRWLAMIMRTFLNVIAMILYFGVIPIMPIAEAGAGLFTAPIFVLIISGVFFREKITKRQILSICLGSFGVVLILGKNYSGLTLYHTFPILAGAFYGLAAIVTNRYLQDEEPLAILLCFLCSIGLVGLMLTIFFTYYPVTQSLLIQAPFIFKPWNSQDSFFWVIMSFLGLLSSLAIYLLVKAYQISRPSYAAIYEYTYLISAGFFSWLFWGITPTLAGICGIIAIVIAGVNIALAKPITPKSL